MADKTSRNLMSLCFCKECQSFDVGFHALVDADGNVCGGPYDSSECTKCGSTNIGDTCNTMDMADLDEIWALANDCQHDPSEDCMICRECGKCKEDLDSDDLCIACGGEDE